MSGDLLVSSFEDLNLVERFVPGPEGLLVPASSAREKPPVCIDLFAGMGGFSLGMEAAGYHVAGALELEFEPAATYLHNLGDPFCCRLGFDSEERRASWERWVARKRKKSGGNQSGVLTAPDLGDPGWIGWSRRRPPDGYWNPAGVPGCQGFLIGDARQVHGEQLLALAGVAQVDVVVGGPPCQGLSRLNRNACLEDPRNGLLWEFLRLVEELRAPVFICENVPQILTVGKGSLFKALCDRANKAGYDVVADILDAANYGVPQHRCRALIVGSRSGRSFHFPMPTNWGIGQLANGENWNMTAKKAARYSGKHFEPPQTAEKAARYPQTTLWDQ